MNNTLIANEEKVRNLGVILDAKLTFVHQKEQVQNALRNLVIILEIQRI